MFDIKACDSVRRHKPQKAEFTNVNEHFWGEHNADSGLYGQTLIINRQ